MRRLLALLAVALGLLAGAPTSHADPYCGPGMNYDPVHGICQPGNPVPAPGLQPYPLPGDYPGYPYPPYGGN